MVEITDSDIRSLRTLLERWLDKSSDSLDRAGAYWGPYVATLYLAYFGKNRTWHHSDAMGDPYIAMVDISEVWEYHTHWHEEDLRWE